MMRRTMAAGLLVLCVATSAWPKFKEDEQQYLNDQFKAIQGQMQALSSQLQTLNAQLQELRQNQAQIQTLINRQQRSVQDLDQMVASMRLGSEENFSNLKTAILQMRKDTQEAFNKLHSMPQPGAGGTARATTLLPPAPAPAQGYVLSAEGSNVTLDMGALAGVRRGSHLALYKASDLATRVGVLEVTQMLEGGKSRARVVTLNSGVQPEFSDVVRLE